MRKNIFLYCFLSLFVSFGLIVVLRTYAAENVVTIPLSEKEGWFMLLLNDRYLQKWFSNHTILMNWISTIWTAVTGTGSITAGIIGFLKYRAVKNPNVPTNTIKEYWQYKARKVKNVL
jgi:hypothetical protein